MKVVHHISALKAVLAWDRSFASCTRSLDCALWTRKHIDSVVWSVWDSITPRYRWEFPDSWHEDRTETSV